MPKITAGLSSGRPQMDEDRLAEAITDDVVNIIKVQLKDFIIVLEEATTTFIMIAFVKYMCFRGRSITHF